ncbi:hypothetical protein PTTG_28024 [Puccinia triticina 1-1 BBBD Race 1]|uniref:Uncharacterized protein n=1 Tax=Puccinia triticina (isolate 1-1 / race 1 (BBBD)) TaxID=630390 RepID=A0A180GFI7_PUCT1|nr:hypothetical protein PTTG_28024 [Puccinia triticina 1-1 BBBD Race 1]WAR58251.1 hypothetical protein PtB15_5B484 [Puccinia triticina]
MSLDSARKARCSAFDERASLRNIEGAKGPGAERGEDNDIDMQGASSRTNRPKVQQAPAPRPSLRSQTRHRSKPLEPYVSRPLEVESIIQRNEHRRARVELGLYLILDQPPADNALVFPPLATRPCYDAEDNYWPDSFSHLSDRSIPCNSSLSSYFTNPHHPSIFRPVKDWWSSRRGKSTRHAPILVD